MRLNLIAQPSEINQLPHSVQCTPTYCNLEPASNRVTVGLRNVSAKQLLYHLGQLYVRYNWPIWYLNSDPRIEDTLDCLHGAVWFSTLDLRSGYWQVELKEKAKSLNCICHGSTWILEM